MILSPLARGPAKFNLTHSGSYVGRGNRRPEIEVDIATVTGTGVLQGTVRTTVLVDSGADCTLLDVATAEPLKIDLSKCRVENIGGIGGGLVQVWFSRVLMYLCGRWVSVEVGFTPRQRPQLLGRADVFDHLLIAFFHQANHLYASTV